MNKSLVAGRLVVPMFVLIILGMSDALAADETLPTSEIATERDWHFNLNVAYSSRALDGTIMNQTAITNDVFGDLVATGDSMNLGSSDGLMLAVGAQYKKWGLGLNYLPTSYSGMGSAIVAVTGGGPGIVVKTPLNTNIDVNMLLANASYNLIQTRDTVFGFGVGFGQTSIDLSIIPDVGNPIIYNGNQPFGFLNMHMSNNYQGFLYGFSLNGISASFSGVDVDYSDYKIDLGYRVIDDAVKFDIIGGYRMVNFAIDIESGQDIVKTSVTLEGPFLGVNISY